MKKNNSEKFMLCLIISLFIIIVGLVFIIIKVCFKKQQNQEIEKAIPNIVIEGVWKAKHIELGEENLGKEYYVVFQKGGKVYTIDDDGVQYGRYFDIGKLEDSNFTLQIEDGPISSCKYDNDDIQCELFDFIEKANIKREK